MANYTCLRGSVLYAALAILICLQYACSPFRIVEYKTYEEGATGSENPGIVFVSKNYKILSIDGKEASYTPILAGAYGGRHLYFLPGKHTIKFNWGNRTASVTDIDPVNFTVEPGKYYKLTSGLDRVFRVYEQAMPEVLPDSTW